MKKVYLVLVVMLLTCTTVFAATPAPPAPKAPVTKATVTPPVPQVAPVDESIKFGMRGDNVRVLQKLLSEKGFYVGEIDGIFGKMTLQATTDFQSSNGLIADGVANKDTLLYLERASSTEFNPSRSSRVLSMSASAYTAHDPGNGKYTRNGNLLRKGLVAVDPTVIPLGTRLYIPGYGYAVADDIGGAIQGNRIDLAFENRSDALQFGRQRITVYVFD